MSDRSAIGPTSCYPASDSTMTPPPTPSRSAANGISQQPSTPYHQQQHMSGAHPVYSPIYFPVQANVSSSSSLKIRLNLIEIQMPFVPMAGTYIIPQGPTPSHHPVSITRTNHFVIKAFLFSHYQLRSIRHFILQLARHREVDNLSMEYVVPRSLSYR